MGQVCFFAALEARLPHPALFLVTRVRLKGGLLECPDSPCQQCLLDGQHPAQIRIQDSRHDKAKQPAEGVDAEIAGAVLQRSGRDDTEGHMELGP